MKMEIKYFDRKTKGWVFMTFPNQQKMSEWVMKNKVAAVAVNRAKVDKFH